MKKTFSIHNPCSENWNEMTPEQQGRHCSTCSTTVADFTKMSDTEIIDALISKKYKCCSVYPEQLKTYDISSQRKKYWNTIAASIIAGLITLSTAQAQKSYNVQKEVRKGDKGDTEVKIQEEILIKLVDAKTKQPIPNLRLYNPVTQEVFTTDSNGVCTIEKDPSGTVNSKIELIAIKNKRKGKYVVRFEALLNISTNNLQTIPMVVELGNFKRTGKYERFRGRTVGCPSF